MRETVEVLKARAILGKDLHGSLNSQCPGGLNRHACGLREGRMDSPNRLIFDFHY